MTISLIQTCFVGVTTHSSVKLIYLTHFLLSLTAQLHKDIDDKLLERL